MPKRMPKSVLIKFPKRIDFETNIYGEKAKPNGLFLQSASGGGGWLYYAGLSTKRSQGLGLPTAKIMRRLAQELTDLADDDEARRKPRSK
jgi:hypothetical protein